MRIMVTGAAGFVGRHLTAELLHADHEVILTDYRDTSIEIAGFGSIAVQKMDISNRDECEKIILSESPAAIIHLAGLAQTVGQSQERLHSVNVLGAVNVAEALSNAGLIKGNEARQFLFVSSAFVYGGDKESGTHIFHESTPVSPRGDYGKSKLDAETSLQKLDGKSLSVYIARPFNHIGPGQGVSFVVPSLVMRIKEASQGSTIATGNLNSIRDFTDVRDVVRAYRLIIEVHPSQRLFVIGSGKPATIQSVYELLVRLSGKSLQHEIADHLKRDEGTAALLSDSSLADRVLGWKPLIPLEQSIQDIWHEHQ
jgi:GDP-4-dehydro-6-deoxy-D-mannose reductase